MQSNDGKMPRVLAAAVMAALFSCQVIGSMCAMAPLAIAAVPAVHQAQVPHSMGTGTMCADSLPSSPKPSGTFDPHAAPLADSVPSSYDMLPVVSGVRQAGAFLADTGPPLYTRLSTFRI